MTICIVMMLVLKMTLTVKHTEDEWDDHGLHHIVSGMDRAVHDIGLQDTDNVCLDCLRASCTVRPQH